MTALMVNSTLAASGIPSCASVTHLAVLQDDPSEALRTAMGADYDHVAVVDAKGQLTAMLQNPKFPEAGTELATIVSGLLTY